jgi:hypothetical protein
MNATPNFEKPMNSKLQCYLGKNFKKVSQNLQKSDDLRKIKRVEPINAKPFNADKFFAFIGFLVYI